MLTGEALLVNGWSIIELVVPRVSGTIVIGLSNKCSARLFFSQGKIQSAFIITNRKFKNIVNIGVRIRILN